MPTAPRAIRFTTMSTLCLLACFALAPATSHAQSPVSEEEDGAEDGPAGEEVIQLEELVVEGEIAKPDAFYILNRTSLGYEILDMRTSFLRDIVEAVEHDPF